MNDHSPEAPFELWLRDQPLPMVDASFSLAKIEALLRSAFDAGQASLLSGSPVDREAVAAALFYVDPLNGDLVFRWANERVTLKNDPYLSGIFDALAPLFAQVAAQQRAEAWDEGRAAESKYSADRAAERRNGKTAVWAGNPYRSTDSTDCPECRVSDGGHRMDCSHRAGRGLRLNISTDSTPQGGDRGQ